MQNYYGSYDLRSSKNFNYDQNLRHKSSEELKHNKQPLVDSKYYDRQASEKSKSDQKPRYAYDDECQPPKEPNSTRGAIKKNVKSYYVCEVRNCFP